MTRPLVLEVREDPWARVELVYHGEEADPQLTVEVTEQPFSPRPRRTTLVPPSGLVLDYFEHPFLHLPPRNTGPSGARPRQQVGPLRIYGVASRATGDVAKWHSTQADAERTLRKLVARTPELEGELWIAVVDVAETTPG